MEEKLNELVEFSRTSGKIDMKLYTEYDVKRGLRDSTGKGVLTGLTEISDVIGFEVTEQGEKIPANGKLYYQDTMYPNWCGDSETAGLGLRK